MQYRARDATTRRPPKISHDSQSPDLVKSGSRPNAAARTRPQASPVAGGSANPKILVFLSPSALLIFPFNLSSRTASGEWGEGGVQVLARGPAVRDFGGGFFDDVGARFGIAFELGHENEAVREHGTGEEAQVVGRHEGTAGEHGQ